MIYALIVDHDHQVSALHRSYVERVEGFCAVGEAHSGADALTLARALRPHLCLLDTCLPDLPGLEVARQLRAADLPPVDVIMVTAAPHVAVVQAAMQGGALDYLVKPFSFATFRHKLERYAAWRARLDRGREADQQEAEQLDDIRRTEEPGTRASGEGAALPRGLARATLGVVEGVLRDAGRDLSATEVASTAGISRVTARRYLEHLTQAGRAQMRPRYGFTGRPEHRYRWIPGHSAGG